MIRKIVLPVAIILSGIVSVFSQSVTETRIIKTTALEVYEKYVDIMNKLYDGNVYNSDIFLSLFNENATLYNDILPANKKQLLSRQEYFDIFAQHIERNKFKEDKLNLKFPTRERDKYLIVCEFSREISFETRKKKNYPNYRFDYTLTITMDTVYDRKNKIFTNAKIQQIVVKEPLNNFFIIENPNDYALEYQGKIIDGWDKEYKNRIFSANNMDIDRITVTGNEYFNTIELTRNQEDEHFYDLRKFKKNLWGLGINYCPYGLGNNINRTNFPDIKQSNQALSIESFFGYQLAQNWFGNIKLGLNAYQNTFNGDYSTQYNAVDMDNDPYLRKISISSLEEKIYNFSASLPLSIEYLLRISNNVKHPVFLSFEAGGYIEYRLWATNRFSFSADYTGLYDYYCGVEFDHYYDYGHFDLSDKEISQSLSQKINRFDYGLLGSLGLWYAFNKNNLLKINFAYKHGFESPLKYKENFVPSENYGSYESLLQGTNQGIRNIYVGLAFVKTINAKNKPK